MSKKKTFILSDESINSYGFRVLTGGADLEQFRKNPVMFYQHNEWGTPIGKWENIRVEDGKILAEAVFDLEDPDAAKIAGKVDRGFLRATSIGLRIVERSEESELMLSGQKYPTVTKWKLRECSIVNIGANDSSLRLYDENDNLMTEEQVVKLFDNPKSINSKKIEMKKETLGLLSLADNASDNHVHDAIAALVNSHRELGDKVKTLTDQLTAINTSVKEERTKEATALTDAAIREGRLNASAREQTLRLFDGDFDGAKAMIEAIPARKSLKDEVSGADKTELEKLSAKSWDELDKSGGLATLKDKYSDVYAEKYKEKFGVEPNK